MTKHTINDNYEWRLLKACPKKLDYIVDALWEAYEWVEEGCSKLEVEKDRLHEIFTVLNIVRTDLRETMEDIKVKYANWYCGDKK